MRPRRVAAAARAVVRERATLGSALGLMVLCGAFTSWIGSAEPIVGDVLDLEARFPLVFGGIAAVLGIGMLVNARIVERFGTRTVTRVTLVAYLGLAAGFVGVTTATGGTPPFWLFAVVLALLLGAHALLVPNVNAVAMEPVGDVAGTASALIGTVQIAGGATLGAVVDRLDDGTVAPVALRFPGDGIVGAAVIVRGLRDQEQPVARPA